MYQLAEGVWRSDGFEPATEDGAFVRAESRFRGWITPDGEQGFQAEAGRYHLFVSLACPWAHRTLIVRKLLGLERLIGVSVVDPIMAGEGWVLPPDEAAASPVPGLGPLYDLYTRAEPRFTGLVTVPVLWDRVRQTIVNNESAEIIRMFNSAFRGLAAVDLDLYPEPLRDAIDAVNERIYASLNNGVYRAGFAATQASYEAAAHDVFATLDWLEQRLSAQPYLVGNRCTEADWRLFTTLVRFDAVYYSHFKCNVRRLIDYPNLWSYTRALYQWPGIADTVNLDHIKRHYFGSHPSLNPSAIVPIGPAIDFTEPHDRARFD